MEKEVERKKEKKVCLLVHCPKVRQNHASEDVIFDWLTRFLVMQFLSRRVSCNNQSSWNILILWLEVNWSKTDFFLRPIFVIKKHSDARIAKLSARFFSKGLFFVLHQAIKFVLVSSVAFLNRKIIQSHLNIPNDRSIKWKQFFYLYRFQDLPSDFCFFSVDKILPIFNWFSKKEVFYLINE